MIKIILLELRAKKPLPNLDDYWVKNGFDVKKRPMSLTLQMLHNFIDTVTPDEKERYVDKSRVDKDKEKDTRNVTLSDDDFLKTLKANTVYKGINIDAELGKMDAWLGTRPGRKKTKRFIINWLNKVEAPVNFAPKPEPKADHNCDICGGKGRIQEGAQRGAQCLCVH